MYRYVLVLILLSSIARADDMDCEIASGALQEASKDGVYLAYNMDRSNPAPLVFQARVIQRIAWRVATECARSRPNVAELGRRTYLEQKDWADRAEAQIEKVRIANDEVRAARDRLDRAYAAATVGAMEPTPTQKRKRK